MQLALGDKYFIKDLVVLCDQHIAHLLSKSPNEIIVLQNYGKALKYRAHKTINWYYNVEILFL